ncbi:MAG: SUMF1/EgtB/PvdO family nonheme iron enzyme [Verrucomicrobiales bacterium]|nr:SUMF1/EgtB/PvdO family nonheme iron enzyme [Verrucomicrobiales bacterium]
MSHLSSLSSPVHKKFMETRMRNTSVGIGFVALLFLISSPWASAAERVAIVFGNNDYAHAPALRNAVNDAGSVAEMLETKLGFTLVKPPKARMFSRSKSIWSDVGIEQFYAGIEAFKREAGKARLGLVYFAGHGMEVHKVNYLIPVDAELDSRVQLRTQAVKVNEILADLKSTRLPNKLLILDCCRDNPLSRSWRGTRSSATGLAELADTDIPESTMILFSAAPGQAALDGEGDNSPFTAALIEELPKPGRDALSAFFKVSDAVVKTTGKRQEPWLKFDGAGRTFREFQFVAGQAPATDGDQDAALAALQARIAAMEKEKLNADGLIAEIERLKREKEAAEIAAKMVKTTVGTDTGGFSAVRGMEGSRAGEERDFGGITFCWCPAGNFMMGSPSSEEGRESDEDQHRVTLTNGFWMAKTECTQAQYESIVGTNPSRFSSADLPVEMVSWEDAVAYCRKLNTKLGWANGWEVALPTEAQWEYGCRGGTSTVFSFGNSSNGREANCDGNFPYGTSIKGPYVKKTSPGGNYAANPWGLEDMHGNVWEWCRDWYGGDYYSSGHRDPQGPSNGSGRVCRGGSWFNGASFCRAADRSKDAPDSRINNLGFRVSVSSTGK